jgi:TPR repeat protein
MPDQEDIDILLQAPASEAVADQLIEWGNETRGGILRGDMMLGIITPETVAKIPMAYNKAADYGRPKAWLMLASWHARPEFGEQDLEAAQTVLQKAIAAGVPEAPLELVKIVWFFKGDNATETEREHAYQILSTIYDAGDPGADVTYLLALLTCDGFGTEASPERAVQLLQVAASLGQVSAMFELSLYYAKGIGVTQDKQASFKACQAAAEAGHPRAMYNLGAFYATGQYVTKNMSTSKKWYEQAAEAGNPSALIGLALIYGTGDGIEADLDRAHELLDQAEYYGLDVSQLRKQLAI